MTETISDAQQPQQKAKNNQQKCQLLISNGWPSNSWHREGVASRGRHPETTPFDDLRLSCGARRPGRSFSRIQGWRKRRVTSGVGLCAEESKDAALIARESERPRWAVVDQSLAA